MAGSGVARITMSKKGSTNSSLKGNYNKRAKGSVSKNVHNQPKSRRGTGGR